MNQPTKQPWVAIKTTYEFIFCVIFCVVFVVWIVQLLWAGLGFGLGQYETKWELFVEIIPGRPFYLGWDFLVERWKELK